jgi:RimJ/RimL family protein N-acetyltransferase
MQPVPVTLELPQGRARLEPLSPAHVPGLFAASQDDEVWRYSTLPRARTVEDMQTLVAGAMEAQATGGTIPFVIIDRAGAGTSGDVVAGTTRYLDIQPVNRALEIGYTWLGAAWRRTSINTECKYLLLRHAFESLGAVRVQLKTDARNQRSRAAIIRIGAVYEGRLRRHILLPDGTHRDSVYFSILDSEWPGVKGGLEEMIEARG